MPNGSEQHADAQSSLTRNLSSLVIGAQLPGGEESAAAGAEQSEPLQRQATSQLNRNRVQENQRILAAQLLQFSLPMMLCAALLLLVLCVCTLVIYVQGWTVMSNYSDKPCDMPLKWWLLMMMLVPIIQCQLNSQNQNDPERRPKRFQALVTPIMVLVGIWMLSHTKTCEKTAPELYAYVKLLLICQSCLWVLSILMSCGLVSLIVWMHRNGLLDSGPGPAMAARPGLIDDVETVEFDPSKFTDANEDDPQPPECSICTEEFEAGKMVKRTPCGHFFCEDCLKVWLSDYGKSCPLCRLDLEQALDGGGAGAGDLAAEP